MKRELSCIIIGIFFWGAQGCALPFLRSQAVVNYYIASESQLGGRQFSKMEKRLLVSEATAGPLVNSHKLLFSTDRLRRGAYQFAAWSEPPPRRLTTLVLEDLERSGLFSSVSRLTNSTLADLQLNIEVREFYHDAVVPPGAMRLIVSAELVDTASRTLRAKREFTKIVESSSFDAAGAAGAGVRALNAVADEIVIWLDEAAR